MNYLYIKKIDSFNFLIYFYYLMENMILYFNENGNFYNLLNYSSLIIFYGFILNLFLFLSIIIFTFLYFYILENNNVSYNIYKLWEDKVIEKYSKKKIILNTILVFLLISQMISN